MNRSVAIKYGSLVFLTLQNSVLIQTLRYSRTTPGPKYLRSTAVLLSELLKLLFSLAAYLIVRCIDSAKRHRHEVEEAEPLLDGQHGIRVKSTHPFDWQKDIIPLLMPAILYTIQNNLQLIAISHLNATTFQVLYQGKILTTAICMVIFLDKRLSGQQCAAIALLTIGICCASMPPDTSTKLMPMPSSVSQEHATGIAAVSAACLLSGMAGVCTEMTLKRTRRRQDDGMRRFWLRNMQLSTISVIFAIPGIFVLDRKQLLQDGFFQGHNQVVTAVVLLQAVGGLSVAIVVTYADNILKGFATSISVILSAAVTTTLDSPMTPLFALGMGCVTWSSWLYATAEQNCQPIKSDEQQDVALEKALSLP